MKNEVAVSRCLDYIEVSINFTDGKNWDITITSEGEDYYFDETDNTPQSINFSIHKSQIDLLREMHKQIEDAYALQP